MGMSNLLPAEGWSDAVPTHTPGAHASGALLGARLFPQHETA